MEKDINLKEILGHNYTVTSISILVMMAIFLVSNFILDIGLKILIAIENQSIPREGMNLGSFFDFRVAEYPEFYGVVSFLALAFAFKVGYKFKSNYGTLVKGQKGTSEFATLKEIKAQYKCVPAKEKDYEGKGGVLISREYKNNKVYIDDSSVNNLIIGTTRSGKGETFVFPTIDIYSRAKEKSSLIINDPKGELVSASYDTLKERGYDIQVLNLENPMNGMSYNPLQIIIDAYKNKEYSKAQTLCNTLTFSLYDDPTAKDKFWQLSAQSLVNAIILAITKDNIESKKEEKITMYTVANFLADMGGKNYIGDDGEEKNALDEFFQKRSSTDIAKMQYATSNFSKGTTRGSIFASAMAKLQIFTFDEIAKMTSKSSYKLEDVGFSEKPVAIFMITPDYDSSVHVMASVFIRQLYYILAKKASLSRGQKCEREVVFLLDEFGNMPPIEGMSNIITVCLGRNIRFNLVIQSYSQLKKLYGDDDRTIIGNCGNQIYVLTSDYSTAEQFSRLIGYKTISVKSRAGKSLSMNKSKNESLDRRELLTPNELTSLEEGETVVVRVIKRQDNKRKKITPKPIYNTGKTMLRFRYEYLSKDFDTSKSVLDMDFECIHKDVKLENLIHLSNKDEEVSEEEITESIAKERLEEYEQEELEEILEDTNIQFFVEMDLTDKTPEDLFKVIEKKQQILGEHYDRLASWLNNLDRFK